MNENMEEYEKFKVACEEYNSVLNTLRDAESNLLNDSDNKELQEKVESLYGEVEDKYKSVKKAFISLSKVDHPDMDSKDTIKNRDRAYTEASEIWSDIKKAEKKLNSERKDSKYEFIDGTTIRKPRDRKPEESEEDYTNFLNKYYNKVLKVNKNTKSKENVVRQEPTTSLTPEGEVVGPPAIANTNVPSVDVTPTDEISGVPAVTDTNVPSTDVVTPEPNTNTPTEQKNNSGKAKWLAGAAGVGLGVTVALTAAGGPVVATAFTVVSGLNLASKAVNGVNWILTKNNERKKKFQKDASGNLILDANGKPKTEPTCIDKIKNKVPDWIKKGVAVVTGNTRNQTWNWFINGVAVGYTIGNIAKNFIPKPDPNQATVTNKTTTNPNPTPQPDPNQVDPGSHWNLDNIDTVYDSADKANGPLNAIKGEYGDAVVRRVIDTPNGRMVDLMSPNGEDLAWVAEEAVKTGIRK